MPRITIEAVNSDSGARRWTLSERIVADNFDSDHYVHQLIERLSWAAADAEDRETDATGVDQSDPSGARRSSRAARSRGDRPGPRSARNTAERRARA